MNQRNPFVITIVGPESSGKTTLARQLAMQYGCPWVPEFAREYLDGLDRGYVEEDLKLIAEGQLNDILSVWSEQSSLANHQPVELIQHLAEGLWIGEGGQKAVLSFPREEFGDTHRPVFIVDSGMMSLRMWARIKYAREIPVVEAALKEDVTSLYLLCRPSLHWEPDPLREAPALLDRVWIYNHYLMELSATGAR